MESFKKVVSKLITSAIGGIILFVAGLAVDRLKEMRSEEDLNEKIKEAVRLELERRDEEARKQITMK